MEMSDDKWQKLQPGEAVDNKWRVVKMLGKGTFGAVYEVKHATASDIGCNFALKAEDAQAPEKQQCMRMEVHILRRVRMNRIKAGRRAGRSAKRHFCELEVVGQTALYRYIVMTLAGKDVYHLWWHCGRKFAGRTVAHVAIESLNAIQELHEIGFIHRDVKACNMAIGTPPRYRDVYLIDFGLCRSYRHEDGRLRRPRDVAGFRGTLSYAPLSTHYNKDLCRRDDLWSWLYMLIEMATGKLAWNATVREVKKLAFCVQLQRVGAVKKELNSNPHEMMSGCAVEFLDLHAHINSLGFYDQPNYAYLIERLKTMEERRRQPDKDGDKLDWEPDGKYHAKISF